MLKHCKRLRNVLKILSHTFGSPDKAALTSHTCPREGAGCLVPPHGLPRVSEEAGRESFLAGLVTSWSPSLDNIMERLEFSLRS